MAGRRRGEALSARATSAGSRGPNVELTVNGDLARYGAESLSDTQIVAALLGRSGGRRAEALLQRAGGLGQLTTLGPSELAALGLTRDEVSRFAVLLELQRRSTRVPGPHRLTSPQAAGAYLLPRVAGWTEERFGMLALNVRGAILGDRILAQGTATACLVSPREFFREALRYGATSAIAWHNHPSGDPTPSRDDIVLTRRLKEAGRALGVPLADHVIVGHGSFHSFLAAEGWL